MGPMGSDAPECGQPALASGCVGPPGCGEPVGPTSVEFVGAGQGNYVKETIYKYVGRGGDFNVVGHRGRLGCICSYICCSILLVALALLFFWPFPKTTTLMFDCDAEYLQWRIKWSHVKKAYCCDFTNKGCSSNSNFPIVQTTPPVPPAAPPPIPMPPPTPPPTQPRP